MIRSLPSVCTFAVVAHVIVVLMMGGSTDNFDLLLFGAFTTLTVLISYTMIVLTLILWVAGASIARQGGIIAFLVMLGVCIVAQMSIAHLTSAPVSPYIETHPTVVIGYLILSFLMNNLRK